MQTMSTGRLFLIPSPLAETPFQRVFPAYNAEIISDVKHFLVEDIRTARRFIKSVNRELLIDEMQFEILDKSTSQDVLPKLLEPIKQGFDMGVISEAGCPGIADPGAELVRLAHEKNIEVIPLVGPSSVLLAHMASGMNGQSFAFNGYLPIKPNDAAQALLKLEKRSKTEQQSQSFIETPYRNMALLELMLKTLSPQTRLCVAANITDEHQSIRTKTISQWRNQMPSLHKIPCIFIIMA